jgi:hypothetical protein
VANSSSLVLFHTRNISEPMSTLEFVQTQAILPQKEKEKGVDWVAR